MDLALLVLTARCRLLGFYDSADSACGSSGFDEDADGACKKAGFADGTFETELDPANSATSFSCFCSFVQQWAQFVCAQFPI